MKKKNSRLARIFELIACLVLTPYALSKFGVVEEVTTNVFYMLGIFPTGQYIVGVIEITACVMLLLPKFSIWGAILALWVMLGALIAHLTVLGLDILGQGYTTFFSLLIILSSSLIILSLRRVEIPLIGKYLSPE